MEIKEARLSVTALYFQAASLSDLDVEPSSIEYLELFVNNGFERIEHERRPEAVANLLRLIAATLEEAQNTGNEAITGNNVDSAHNQVCPVYPFD